VPSAKTRKTVAVRGAAPVASPKRMAGELVLHGIRITHPDRVVSETGRLTKRDLAEYYAAVAPLMLPAIAHHPLSLLRCPSGIDDHSCFFQRAPGRGLGPDVFPFHFANKGKTYEYLYIKDEKGLIELVQMGSVEIHPWGARVDGIDHPERMIFDLDPAPELSFDAVKLAARDLRQRLQGKGLESTLKCTGGKGLHVTVPLAGKDEWARVKSFAASVVEEMIADVPAAYVAAMAKVKRTGKIFLDYFRNDYTATTIADYSVRARAGVPVALPLDWDELEGLKSASQFTVDGALERIRKRKPPQSPTPQRLP